MRLPDIFRPAALILAAAVLLLVAVTLGAVVEAEIRDRVMV